MPLSRIQLVNNVRTLRILVKRDVENRIVGTSLGWVLYVISPIFLLSLYTYVFNGVLKLRWAGEVGDYGEFALRLFAGLIIFLFFSEAAGRAGAAILDNVSYVKKVVFPLEVLVPSIVGTALFTTAINYAILVIAYMLLHSMLPPITVLAVPVLWVPLVLITCGFGWILAAVGAYLRDTPRIIATFLPAVPFITPIFFPLSYAPEGFRVFLMMNPLTYFVEATRDCLFDARWPDPVTFLLVCMASFMVFTAGYWVFMTLRRGFADVV